jgi:hypothetical protein
MELLGAAVREQLWVPSPLVLVDCSVAMIKVSRHQLVVYVHHQTGVCSQVTEDGGGVVQGYKY